MSTSSPLREQRAAVLTEAKTIVARATKANRDLTTHEADTLDGLMGRVTNIDKQIKGKALVDSVLRLGTAEDDPDARGVFNETAKAGIVHAVKSRTTYRTEVDRKALTSGTLLPTVGRGVEPGLWPNIFPIASLFRQEPAAGPTTRYYRFDGAEADIVAEGALKPDAGLSITPVDVALAKIAVLTSFSDEMSEDAPYLVAHLAAELSNAVVTRENQAILDTFNAVSGLLTGTGAAGNVVDLVADAVAGQEAISGVTPSAIIAHPATIATIRKARADGSTGGYTVDPLSASPTALHGVQLISTPATATGVVWVVGGQGVVIYRRGPITVEIDHGKDGWEHNTRTMRAEQRMATAVVRPSSITRLTLT
ncbi:phage major capsid protein [Nocardioides campestrisoli]|uniref:phage major capsid protein n=1 Tax=Nocardioides campestrisoli TaxID=2736757 RepID=UPI00163D59AE|nr:phage major capsid protein [Nocardioides campestrisoli]